MAKRIYLGGNPLSTYDFDTQNPFKGIILGEAITVDGDDFILTLDSDNELSSTISISIEGNTLKLVGSNGQEKTVDLPTVDVSTLFSLRYDEESKSLILSFDDKEEPISLEELVDVYKEGEGLKLDEKVFSVDTDVIATVESVNKIKSELETSINEKAIKSEFDTLYDNVEELAGEVAELEADKIHDLENTNCIIIEKQDVGTDEKNRTVKIGLDEKVAKFSTVTLPNGRYGDEKEFVELGNSNNQTIVNSKNRLIVREGSEYNDVAYLTDLEEKQDKGDYVTWSEYNGQEGRKILKLAHRDTIAGESPKGGSQIAMVSDYEELTYPVVEFGSTRAAMVLNSVEDRVKVEVNENDGRKQHSIATLDDIEALRIELKNYIDEEIKKLS